MAAETFEIGDEHGLILDVHALLQVLAIEARPELSVEDLAVAEDHLRAVLQTSVELTETPAELEVRTREGEFLAVGSLGRLGLSVVLGPLLHVVAAGTALSALRRLLKFDRGWRPHLVAIYARLSGLQRDVFEEIHAAQNSWVIVNYDAHEAGRFAEAFGRVAPTAGDLTSALADRVNEAGVREVLMELISAGIVETDGARFWIRF